MPCFHFLSVNGDDIAADLPQDVTADSACYYLTQHLALRPTDIRIVNTLDPDDGHFLSSDAACVPRPAFFQVISKEPTHPEFSPALRFRRILQFSQRPVRDAYSDYGTLHRQIPADFEARVSRLAHLGYPPELCSEVLFLVQFNTDNATHLLLDPPLRSGVEKAFIQGLPIPTDFGGGRRPPGDRAEYARPLPGRRIAPMSPRERELRRRLELRHGIGEAAFASLYEQAHGNLDEIERVFPP
jgi:hypothetical protein